MEKTEIVTRIRINQMVDVVFDIEEIIAAINAQPIEIRMNLIAHMLNCINSFTFSGLEPGHQKIIIQYLRKTLNAFEKYSPEIPG